MYLLKTVQKNYFPIIVFVLCFFCCTSIGAQRSLGVNFHQSVTTRVGVFYDLGEELLLETRVVGNLFLTETAVEFLLFYKFIPTDNYELYGGGGYSASSLPSLEGFIVAAGVNVYPFENKQIGFHVELNPIILGSSDEFAIVKASWGLRYRFSSMD